MPFNLAGMMLMPPKPANPGARKKYQPEKKKPAAGLPASGK
jgi:hypothetical protein